MYKVLVVDDEPAAVQYVKKLVELKCEGFEVCGSAVDGLEALDWLKQQETDVIVTDVMMPRMNGIELVLAAQEQYPNAFSVVVSGYQDFEFVQGAIRAGVCDYLLKPIDPGEIQRLFGKIKALLDKSYYQRRNQIFHQLGARGKNPVDWEELTRIFPGKRYYAAIIRRNEMFARYSRLVEAEVYSMENEQIIIYGRDNMEMLYLYDEDLIIHDFLGTMYHEFYKQQEEGAYLTMVLKEDPFAVTDLPQVMEQLYTTLDHSIVVGLEQKIFLGREMPLPKNERSERKFDHLMYLVRSREVERVLSEMSELFELWRQECCPQIRVKEKIRYLLYEMQSSRMLTHFDEYLFEDAFSNVENMSELSGNIGEFIRQNLADSSTGKRQEKEEVFAEIVEYLTHHPAEKLSVQAVCKRFGISQATLNRMFRSYTQMSYSSYLTDMRIQIAQKLLRSNPESYIKDVAAAVGYGDQFYFSRIFRTVTGMSPSEYVEKLS